MKKLNNFAAKIVVGERRKYVHAAPRRKELEWLNIRDECVYEKCPTVYKVINVFKSFPTVSESTTTSMTRQGDQLRTQGTDSGAAKGRLCLCSECRRLRKSSKLCIQPHKSAFKDLDDEIF